MSRPSARRGLLACGMGLVLAGCGFQPLYMPTASGKPGVAQRELEAVHVALIPGRPGQLFRQALQVSLASDAGAPQRYDLEANFWIAGEGVAIQQSNIATRMRLTGNVVWTLRAHDPARTRLTGGSSRMLDGFNVFDQQYFAADLENEQAQRRIATAMAGEVATQLAIYFRQHAEG